MDTIKKCTRLRREAHYISKSKWLKHTTTTTTNATSTLQLQLHSTYTTPHYIQQLWMRWPLQPLQKVHRQLQPHSVHQWILSAIHASQQPNLSHRFPIFETSATALCGTSTTRTYYHSWKCNSTLCRFRWRPNCLEPPSILPAICSQMQYLKPSEQSGTCIHMINKIQPWSSIFLRTSINASCVPKLCSAIFWWYSLRGLPRYCEKAGIQIVYYRSVLLRCLACVF